MEIYCVKCKEKTTAKSPKKVTMKNGMNAVQGICSLCGSKVSVITGKSDKAVTRNSSQAAKAVADSRPLSSHIHIAEAVTDLLRKEKSPTHKAFLEGVYFANCLAGNGEVPSVADIIRYKCTEPWRYDSGRYDSV